MNNKVNVQSGLEKLWYKHGYVFDSKEIDQFRITTLKPILQCQRMTQYQLTIIMEIT
jgi:hypothetical protein